MLAMTLLCLLLQAGSPPMPDTSATQPDSVSAAQLYEELRTAALTTPYDKLEIERSDDFPKVYGIVMDWPISDEVVTLVSYNYGSASLYSPSGFGVIGGEFHEFVRRAAIRWVKTAEEFYDEANPVKDFALPDSEHIRFYLLGYDGARMIEATEAQLGKEGSKYFALWDKAQMVITELRLIVDQVETGP